MRCSRWKLTVVYIYNDVTYTITSSASSGGQIDPSGIYQVYPGIDETFTMTPDNGYKLDSLTVNGAVVNVEETMTSSVENGLALYHFDGSISDSVGTTSRSGNAYVSENQIKFGSSALYFDQSSYLQISVGDTYAYTIEFLFYLQGDNTPGWYPTVFSTNTMNTSGGTSLTTDSTTPGATGSSSTLQPYVTCYMWKRTA